MLFWKKKHEVAQDCSEEQKCSSEKLTQLTDIFERNTVEQIVRNETLKNLVEELHSDHNVILGSGRKLNDHMLNFLEMKTIKKPVFEIGDKITEGKIIINKKFPREPLIGTFVELTFIDEVNDIEFTLSSNLWMGSTSCTCKTVSFSNIEMEYLVDKATYALHRKEMEPKEEFRDKLVSIYCKEENNG